MREAEVGYDDDDGQNNDNGAITPNNSLEGLKTKWVKARDTKKARQA